MPKVLRPVLALTLAVGLAAPAAAQDADADTVVATVGDTEITLGHMIVMRAQLPAEYSQVPDEMLFDAVLDQLIRQSAVAQSIAGDLSKGAELALENERRSFLAGEALSKLAAAAVTDTAVQQAYDAAYAEAEPTMEYNAAHILVATEDEAKALNEELEGGADFTELAKENSTGPSGPNGGDLGWFEPGMMVKSFEDAVMALEPGEVSDPVETQFGWHVIKLNETRMKAAPPLEEVREELANTIQREAIETAMTELTEAADVTRAEVEIDPSLLSDRSLLDE
ncbi:peptidyl-prolyl cis-trans isomerase C [Rhodovulum iodosum]|uniref:Parvulin-like PPIase n=1 Tax=Rhodovulum iodosum TaxID=68291 RepID=A0ABV3XSF8_9RHOB|nr:peptidylprolyl isomerase [Rhodovulum robiginosum]RSK30363.1 peptidylprolyl isomerase [Rhodovulum robiginosum]